MLRAYYYFELFRIYGPIPLIGEDPIPLDASKEELIKVRNSVDECVEFIANELQKAIDSGDLPNRVSKNNLGRMDVGICKALKAKLYLYWASPLFNGNTDMASVKNLDGKQLFPQTEDLTKWNKANEAYKEFFSFATSQNYGLTKVYTDGKLDPYKSCRAIAAFYTKNYDVIFNELIMVKLRDQWDYTYWTCPKFSGFEDTSVSGGGGYYTTQETVDMFFTKNGLTIDRDPSYNKFEGVPSAGNFTSGQYYDENDTELKYFDADNSYVLKQWKDREARFYVNVTYNGSIWLNHGSQNEEHRTDFTNGARGTCGKSKASGDCPDSGYLIRKGAKATEDDGSKMFSPTLRVADMILGYAETLCMCDDLEGALLQLNQIRERAGIPEYSFTNEGGKVFCPKTKNDLLNRIRRERIVELVFEWNRFFDVRRWKVAEGNNDPDHWIYPEYHKGGEGGNVYGMNMDKDYPDFFARTLLENRANFSKKQYFMPIPYDDIRRIPELVQNLGW
ncbi:MAG: RagB/SusD family nutrient uptake outer membrane protein [Bacteroides thetaiotaomicron]